MLAGVVWGFILGQAFLDSGGGLAGGLLGLIIGGVFGVLFGMVALIGSIISALFMRGRRKEK
jgi:hypothetical protein